MIDKNSVLLFITDTEASIDFYTKLLGQMPIEASPTFGMFILPSGLGLGLWKKTGVEPAPTGAGGGSEIGFHVPQSAMVDTIFDDWKAKGVTILMPPTDLDFGRCFVATDPDGHRLRVYTVDD